jgi:hypothetical protein
MNLRLLGALLAALAIAGASIGDTGAPDVNPLLGEDGEARDTATPYLERLGGDAPVDEAVVRDAARTIRVETLPDDPGTLAALP